MKTEELIIDIEGFEGPLDLLLALGRSQKVDLMKISILDLAEQYLNFVNKAEGLRIELAADYLVMAAWLAFLKSRLLLPPDPEDPELSGQELAARLAFQLERLQAMRDAAARLMARDQKYKDFFPRGIPERFEITKRVNYTATLHDLMLAYSRIKTRDEFRPFSIDRNEIMTAEQAMEQMRIMIGFSGEWKDLSVYLPEGWKLDPKRRRTATAATFAASLEMAKSGHIELRQDEVFGAIELKRKEVL